MNQELAKKASGVMVTWEEKLETVKAMVDPDKKLTIPEFEAFCYQAKRTGLDPLARQIYFTKQGNKISVCATIDGLRLVAQRTGHYAGQEGPFWCGEDGQWVDVWLKKNPPTASKVGVIHSGFKATLWAVATWDQYCPMYQNKPAYMWQKMGPHMLAKCTEALALRKAFPQELAGIYSQEEMDQAGAVPLAPIPVLEAEANAAHAAAEASQGSASSEVIDEKPKASAKPEEEEGKGSRNPYVAAFREQASKAKNRDELLDLYESAKKFVGADQLAHAKLFEIRVQEAQRIKGTR